MACARNVWKFTGTRRVPLQNGTTMNTKFENYAYKNNTLYCEDVNLQELAKKHGTPLYVYSHSSLEEQFKKLDQAFQSVDHLICFSVKANPNQAILRSFFNLGAGADVVSGGELQRAILAGCDPQKIVFSGVGKTDEEIELALDKGIRQFNVESEQELDRIEDIAQKKNQKAAIAFRVNPDVDAKTHPYISTGLRYNKFGVSHKQAITLYKKASQMSHIEIVGIDCHIGSQLTDISPFTDAMQRIRELVLELREQGIHLKSIDIGGGLGIRYKDEDVKTPEEYAKAILEPLKDLKCQILLEPGRFLVGNSGAFLTQVVYIKENEEGKHFTIVDGAFNDLMRPMLYHAYHEILPVTKEENRREVSTDVVGPICETTDSFAKDRVLHEILPNEVMAIMSAGAYGASMASLYNSRPRPKEILVREKETYLIKEADSLEDIIRKEKMPGFLKK